MILRVGSSGQATVTVTPGYVGSALAVASVGGDEQPGSVRMRKTNATLGAKNPKKSEQSAALFRCMKRTRLITIILPVKLDAVYSTLAAKKSKK
jgi:hypothetical protein